MWKHNDHLMTGFVYQRIISMYVINSKQARGFQHPLPPRCHHAATTPLLPPPHCAPTHSQRKLQSAPTPPVGSQHSYEPTVKPHILPHGMDFHSGKGVVRGRRGQQLGFAVIWGMPGTAGRAHHAPITWYGKKSPSYGMNIPLRSQFVLKPMDLVGRGPCTRRVCEGVGVRCVLKVGQQSLDPKRGTGAAVRHRSSEAARQQAACGSEVAR